MTVGEKIVKLRKEQNLTQEQFADMLKVSRQSVSKWELDSTYPDTEKLIRMFIVKLNYPKLQNKNGHCCKSKLDKVAKVVYRLSGTV